MKKYSGNTLALYSFYLILSITILWGTKSFGQLAVKNIINKDAPSAKEIHDSIIEPGIPSTGNNSKFWYKFSAAKDTILLFDIVPFDPTHDYDFMLYKCANANCAEEIKSKRLSPIRTCLSINYDKLGSTGLSPVATQTYVAPGPGYGYAATLPVKAGETYYIMVEWPYSNALQKGFKLYLYNLWPKKPKRLMSKPAPKAKEIVLENILFETNKSILLKGSYAPLDSLAQLLSLQKTMSIEIKGHTDNVGDEIKNQELSEKRAKAIFDYLISKKISGSRLSYHGLGSKEPIATNETEEGRRKNRRVGFVVITK